MKREEKVVVSVNLERVELSGCPLEIPDICNLLLLEINDDHLGSKC